MGTYLSKPNTDTVSDQGKSRSLSFGVSSMQGWRITQEDAHVCLLNFDEESNDTSLFAVFDGHGGAEVAEYAAKHLPSFIKRSEFYHKQEFEKALIESFLSFDQSLLEPHVLQILKDMAEAPSSDDEGEQINEAIALQEEAEMPIDQLMAKYGCVVLKKDEKEEGGDVAAAGSSKSAVEEKQDIPKEPDNDKKSAQNGSGSLEEVKTENGGDHVNNGSVVNKSESDVKTDVGNGEQNVDGATNGNEELKIKLKIDKGKGKKIIIPKRVETEEKKPLYEKFVEDFDDEDSEEESESGSEDDDDEEEDSEDDGDDDEEDDDDHEVSMGLGEVPGKDSGCTACVVFVKGCFLYVANAGDSRCVVCRDGVAVDMSIDHKPEDDIERNRIEKAGGQVTADGRVNGGLNLSRALGDHTYKDNAELPLKEQMISPEPDVKKLELTDKDEFFVVACDGIWNSMTSQEVVNFVRERIQSKSLADICKDLFHACLAPDSTGDGTGCDNMTAVIVELKNKTLKRKMDGEDIAEKEESCKKTKDQVVCSSSSSSSST